jgi:TRAP-type mannitol/chloroaromatic compound transport system permease large subunit
MELLSIAALLLGFLALLLGAGVWIAVALMATGWAGMQFAGGNIPAGSVLATTVWGNSASWSLAALPLFIWMGEILFRTRLSEEMFRGFAPWPPSPRSRCRN